VMFAAGAVLASAGVWRWGGQPGTGLLLLALLGCLWYLARDVRRMGPFRPASREPHSERDRGDGCGS
jgi:hypothetical protein